MATLKMGSTTVLTDTTLANAVQDNVTRLGTVTAGNLSHADIVYPAGHIIQVKGTDNYHTQTFDADDDIVVELSLTNVLASSHVAIWTTMTISLDNANAEGFETYIFSHTVSMGSVGDDASNKRKINATGGNMGEATFSYTNHGGIVAWYLSTPYMCIDTAPATGNNFYALLGSAFDNAPVITHAGNCSILLMEIAQ